MIGLKSNTLHYVKHLHFFFIFIKMKKKCKKSEGDVSHTLYCRIILITIMPLVIGLKSNTLHM